MKINIKNIKVSEIVQKYKTKIFVPTPFQRQADAWSKRTKQELIISILKGSYIPPLLFSKNNILDGLQRISALDEYINKNEFKISSFWSKNDEGEQVNFEELGSEWKSKLFDHELIKIDLLNDDNQCLTDIEEKELFCKINTSSSKLSQAEMIFTSCKPTVRKMILDITNNNENLNQLSQNKKLKRFQLPFLILWCLTIIYYRNTGFYNSTSKQSIRNDIKKFVEFAFDEEIINNFIKKSKKTIFLMNAILKENAPIPPGKFKVIFSAVFVAMYEKIDSYNAFLLNKEKIAIELQNTFNSITKSQEIGGIHYDSYFFFKNRVNEIMNVIKKYEVDQKRFMPLREKIKLYYDNVTKNGGNVVCCECGKIINKWSDVNVDHIFAHTNGGKSEIKNSQILCEKCNKKKNKF